MMKKVIYLLAISLFAFASTSCKHEVEIVVKNGRGQPYIGADVRVISEKADSLKKYVNLHNKYRAQFEYTISIMRAGRYSFEQAEEEVKKFYEKQNEHGVVREYLTHQMVLDAMMGQHRDFYTTFHQDNTNGFGTTTAKLTKGKYNVYITDGTDYKLIEPLHVSGKQTVVYELK